MNRREFLLSNLIGGAAILASRKFVFSQSELAVEKRVDEIIKQLSLNEKIQFLRGDGDFSSQGNARLNLPGISMADSPQGVRIEGNATVFPAPVAMAATWNIDLIEQVGAALGRELKAKGRDMLLGPCVNIHRSPLGGRNVESFGEDPHLSGKIAVAYIKGVQGEQVAACVKHFAANNIETRRLFLDVKADLRYLHEIEFPPFKMAIEEGKAFGVMASYNQVNGHYSWANKYLLTDVLRNDWNYQGIITSDWGCEWMLPEEQSVLESIEAGTNVQMPTGYYIGNSLAEFVKEGKVKESAIDNLVRQNLSVFHKLGLINNKKKIDQSKSDTKAHHELARKAAAESIVLLKNEQAILPLDKTKIKTLAVIGANAAVAQLGDRGSVYAPTSYAVSPLDGLKNKLGNSVKINYAKGFEIKNFKMISADFLQTLNGKKGLFGEFFTNKDFAGKPVLTNLANELKFDWGANLPKETAGGKTFAARWTGKLLAPASKIVFIGLKSDGTAKLYVDNKLLIENIGTWTTPVNPNDVKYARIDLKAGQNRDIKIEYERGKEKSAVELVWADVPENPFAEAIEAAKNSDYAIVFGGLNIDYEGEGLDRFDMNLPDLQNELIEAVAQANPKTIVAVNSGTPNDLTRWIEKIPAVLQLWYPGIEGGNAVADVLFGDVNPSGKLPVTFGRHREDYGDYPFSTVVNDRITYGESIFVGYRHFDRQNKIPLFPFGHGLSYTSFDYKNLSVKANSHSINISFDITNIGRREGSETAQLYVSAPQSRVIRPPKELKSFVKINLAPGKTGRISFQLKKENLAFYDSDNRKWTFEPGNFNFLVGSSAADLRLQKTLRINA